MTNAVVDRVDFSNAKLKGAKFINAVVTGGGCRRCTTSPRQQAPQPQQHDRLLVTWACLGDGLGFHVGLRAQVVTI